MNSEPLLIELSWPAKELSPRFWSEADIALLRAAYADARVGKDLGLDALAAKLGRHKTNVSRKARLLGLTDIARPKTGERKDRRKYGDQAAFKVVASQVAKDRIAKNGHPRGMLGKKHTAEVRRVIGEKSAAIWASMTEGERAAHTLKGLKTRLVNQGTLAPQVARGTWKAGWREIGGKRHYFRSRWEANYARWLQLLKERGEIADWEFEPHTFWFEKILRGVRSYKPDFRVTGGPGEITWHEVKGWMGARSQTTLKRMAKYHPNEIVILIRDKQIKSLARNFSAYIEGWE